MDETTFETSWADELWTVLAQAGAETARAYLADSSAAMEDEIVVAVQSTFYIGFKTHDRTLAQDANGRELAAVKCVCTKTQPGVCVCKGNCTDQDDCKDPPDAGPIVAKA
jgi:hypothetical protein